MKMNRSREDYFRSVISGRERGLGAAALRGAARVVEPFYAAATRLRNWTFDARLRRAHAAPRPVVCVGNLTTGGTGKTPVVRWLADALRRRGHRPAVLMRGYGSDRADDGESDERRLIEILLSDPALPPVPVIANPDRLAGAARAIEIDAGVSLLILDDGFQHRRLRRDFDLVLIDATNPLGHGRLLPRGLLREPLSGLRRATAMLVTHADETSLEELSKIERTLRDHNAFAPLYRCRHVHHGFVDALGLTHSPQLAGRRYFAFCGIGNPEAFAWQLESAGGTRAGSHWFADHHAYTESDLRELRASARTAGADVMITTEKDWVKLAKLPPAPDPDPPIRRAVLGIEFFDDDGGKLLEQILGMLAR
jgi:tetraacyldisaccharide 4'-kinase